MKYVDIAAFGKEGFHDVTTATISVFLANGQRSLPEIFDTSRALASPAALLYYADHLELWSIPAPPQRPQRLTSVPLYQLDAFVDEFRSDLNPADLYRAKLQGQQLRLFPIDVSLLAHARQGAASELTQRIEEAIASLMHPIPDSKSRQERKLVHASKIVVSSLAALMLRDKLDYPAEPEALLTTAAKAFPSYFSFLLTGGEATVTGWEGTLELLGADAHYASLDSATVSDVYEHALVSQNDKLRLGVF